MLASFHRQYAGMSLQMASHALKRGAIRQRNAIGTSTLRVGDIVTSAPIAAVPHHRLV